MTFTGLAITLELAGAVSAVLVARRWRSHWPAAVAISALALFALARFALRAALSPLPRPVEGTARLLVFLDGAAELGCIATMAGLACAVASRHRGRAIGGTVLVWAVASVVLGALYPSALVRGNSLRLVYITADGIAMAVSALALLVWAQRLIAEKQSPCSAGLVALGLLMLDAIVLGAPISPWRSPLVFVASFSGVAAGISLFFAAIAAAQGIALWTASSST